VHLARKLSLIFVLLGAAVLAGQILFELEHEIRVAGEDARADHRLLGRALSGGVTAAWRRGGREQALELLDRTNRFQQQVVVRWVWVDGQPTQDVPRIPAPRLQALDRVGFLSFELDDGPPQLISYVPVAVNGRAGAIEISESILSHGEVALRGVRSVAVSSALLGGLFLIATVLIGRRLIGEPVQSLVQLAQQVEIGKLDARASLERNDELGLLAAAMNKMARGRQEANARLAQETAAKLEAQESARHADRLSTVGKLAAGVAHELGTPLNVVDGRARMIAAGSVAGPAAQNSARIISEQVSTMIRIIRQLLDFARRRPPKREAQPLQPLVARTLDLLRPLALRRSVTLHSEVGPQVQALVDPDGICQVLTNLVMNSIQAMERPGQVRIRALEESRAPPPHLSGAPRRWLRIEVEDEGPGIRPEIRPHIFEPFFTTKEVGEGTGLGLFVSYGIIQDHGGWIAVEPDRAVGARLQIYLPA